jgi:hypothetical protein
VVGEVIAMLRISLICIAVEVDWSHDPLDTLMAGCVRGQCCFHRHFNFGVIEMDTAGLLNQTSGGFGADSMASLLVACHVLVTVIFCWLRAMYLG